MAQHTLIHITTEGERWDTIAYAWYGDAHRYAPIIAANPHVPITPVLPAGLRLNIPVLARQSNNTLSKQGLPPWMR